VKLTRGCNSLRNSKPENVRVSKTESARVTDVVRQLLTAPECWGTVRVVGTGIPGLTSPGILPKFSGPVVPGLGRPSPGLCKNIFRHATLHRSSQNYVFSLKAAFRIRVCIYHPGRSPRNLVTLYIHSVHFVVAYGNSLTRKALIQRRAAWWAATDLSDRLYCMVHMREFPEHIGNENMCRNPAVKAGHLYRKI
jgi:hypothetical protein